MVRKIALVVGLVLVGLVGYAAYARSRGALMPGAPLPPLPESLAPVIQAGDSTALAEFARSRCKLLRGAAHKACYEDFLLQLVKQRQVKVALGALNLIGQKETEVEQFGHDYSHVIGINAWAPGEDIGKAYLQCSELYQSGCYHGVIQAYFANIGSDSAKVAGLCRDTKEISESGWLRFQCVHGIGHGLVQTYTMNLPRALGGCDWLGSAWDAESCYGGAFMEFIVGGRGQSHHAHVMAAKTDSGAEMDHSKMDHDGMDHPAVSNDTFPPFPVRDSTDLLFPCSKLGDRYQRACYEMQPGLVVERTGLDFTKVAQVCDGAPEVSRATCYQGIGTYVSGVTNRNAKEGTRLCTLGNRRYHPWCLVGLVKNFVDVTANPQDGLDFCLRLTGPDILAACYNAVGEETAVLWRESEKRAALCDKVPDPVNANSCRYGAGLVRERPRDLPIN